jgi:hypothetical protein
LGGDPVLAVVIFVIRLRLLLMSHGHLTSVVGLRPDQVLTLDVSVACSPTEYCTSFVFCKSKS